MFLPISNNYEFSYNFFKKESVDFINKRLDEQNCFTRFMCFDERNKYINDYKAMRQVLKDKKSEGVSNCCNAPLVEETDICSNCNEHCERIEDE